MRIALIFDNQVRPDTTGVYCLRALQGFGLVEHFLPGELEHIPRRGFDLYLNIDDGLRYRLPEDLHPCAWWAIDTHLDFGWYRHRGHDFDFVFAAQRDGSLALRDEGLAAHWLPLACDPDIHRPHPVAREYDVCFVGHLFPGPRTDLVRRLQEHFPNTFVGQRYFEDMARTYSASRVVFNRSVREDVNMRVFEALACGSLLVTNDLSGHGQADLFRAGEHLVTYRDEEELLDRIAYYLAHEDERERIAAAGRAAVLRGHTYAHRMQALLAVTSGRRSTSRNPGASGGGSEGPLLGEGGIVQGPVRFAPAVPGTLPFPLEALPLPGETPRVLLVGPESEALGRPLQTSRGAEVVVAEVPRAEGETALPPGPFDALVCVNVLAQFPSPTRWLQEARGCLRPGGMLVVTLPNARSRRVLSSLLVGNWTYGPGGVTESRKCRFFTRRSIERLFREAGWTLSRLAPLADQGEEVCQDQDGPLGVALGRHWLSGLAPEEAEEFQASRLLAVAVPADSPFGNTGGSPAGVQEPAPSRAELSGG
ncbi:MAG: glycosyltransferase [Planctomycetes bacterium]|nr:glycosyltransferase [Planctomycetota bacterium]